MNSDLQSAIDKLVEKIPLTDLAKARDSLTLKYRNPERFGNTEQLMTSDLERLSYLVTRMPATYAVILNVLTEIKRRFPVSVTTMLDLGSGPGTAFFAALDAFEDLQKAHLIEKDADLIRLGKRLLEATSLNACQVTWQTGNITHLTDLEEYDLVTISYAMNELETSDQKILVEKAFKAAKKMLVIIEPGTKEGFRLIKEVRSKLTELGGHILAPCPHNLKCPMPENDWCHFSERVSRTSAHRHLKGGVLGHEDEKFSYIAVSKSDVLVEGSRVVRHPEKHSGHLKLNLCTKENGLVNKTVSKRDGELYKQARKLDWGDLWAGG